MSYHLRQTTEIYDPSGLRWAYPSDAWPPGKVTIQDDGRVLVEIQDVRIFFPRKNAHELYYALEAVLKPAAERWGL